MMRHVGPLTVFACIFLGAVPAAGQQPPTLGQAVRGLPEVPAAERLSGESIFGGVERIPRVLEDGRLELPPIASATTRTEGIGTGRVPPPALTDEDRPPSVLPESVVERDPQWASSTYLFAAPNTFSHPLYFEDVMLERHGHERFPALQPMISGARFVGQAAMLPYLMTVRPPADFEYKMGHFRPGDPVYPYLQRPPYVRNAAIVQGIWVSGAAVAWP